MEDSQYTLPGVMRYLRSEWQRREREKIEWDIEKAEMRSRIARLESEKLELQRERDEARRHLDILSLKSKPALAAASLTTADDYRDVAVPERNAARPDAELNERITDTVLATVSESRVYLGQCIADIRSMLRQSGMIQGDFVPIAPFQPGFGNERCVTLANFGTAASSLAALPDGRIVAGTVDGDILVWNELSKDPTVLAHHAQPINCLAYSDSTRVVLAAAGSQLLAYSALDSLKLVAQCELSKATILYVAVSPKGNLIATVQDNGNCTVHTLVDGSHFNEMSQPSNSAHACNFVELDDEIHLVIAMSADATESPNSSESGILFVDPLTGQKLKKIVFTASAGIGAIVTTDETVVVGFDNGDLRAIGLARGETVAEVPAAHRGEVTSLSTLKKDTLLSTSTDGRVSLWSLPDLLWKGRLFSHDSGYGALSSASLHDGVVIGGGDGLIRVYREK